jgi:hypothetical protein
MLGGVLNAGNPVERFARGNRIWNVRQARSADCDGGEPPRRKDAKALSSAQHRISRCSGSKKPLRSAPRLHRDFCRPLSGCIWLWLPDQEARIFAADERRWTQMSR